MGCAELIEARDWAPTALGPRAAWPASLRSMVEVMLHTRQPMLLFWGPDWTQFYNDAFVPSFGVGKHPAAMGQSARECWTDAWPVVGAQLEAVVARGEPSWHEDTLIPILRNGRMEEVFWTYSYSPAYDDAGAIAGVLVIVTEMTGRVLAARRLAALAQLGIALGNATTHDEVIDAVFALAAACPADVPFVVADVRGRRRASEPDDLTPPVAIEMWPEPVTELFGAGPLTFGLSPRLPHDAAYLGFLTQIGDQVTGALRRIDDAHDRARADAERVAMVAALDEANRAKDDFLAMLGHELRNPLAPIVAALELMRAKDPTMTAERAAMERQVHHVVRLVDDLLDVSRIARGKLELQRSTTRLGDVIATAVEITRSLIEQRRHALTVDVEPGIALDADATRLVQVVSNLLVNAARYTPPGGTIALDARRDGGDVVIRVRDNGQGIAPELLPRIFDLFLQGKRTTDRTQGGLGIGLAIVKNLVAAHGGTIAAHSDGDGRGALFTVRLPAAAAPAAELAPSPAQPASGKRVLLVDDNEDAAHLLGDIVRARGHEVVVIHHPQAALDALREFVPDLAVLDIGLPDMDGHELGRRIRALHPACRVVALSGYGRESDRQRSIDAGFFAHLVKPVRVDVFLQLLG